LTLPPYSDKLASGSQETRRVILGEKAAVLAVVVAVVVCGFSSSSLSYQPLKIVDLPTAGLYARGEYGMDIDVYSEGGLLVGLGVGFAEFMSFGISYGGINVIGSGDPDWNPRPEVNIRVRVLEENMVMPAIGIGFDSQGHGKYDKYYDRDSTHYEERYLEKSRGFYAVASKNWEILGPFSLHGGISYSLENKTDHDPTIFVGVIKSLGGFADLAAEYDFASNDNEGPITIVEKRGYLNASVAWYLNENLSLTLDVRDIAATGKVNAKDVRKWNRGLSISYRGKI
jgi:hypothetical protein